MLSFFIYTFGIINILFYGPSVYFYVSDSNFGMTAWLAAPSTLIVVASLVAMVVWRRESGRRLRSWAFSIAAGLVCLGLLVMTGNTVSMMGLDGAGILLFMLWPMALVQLVGAVFWTMVAFKFRPTV